ncbi:MAG: Mrp/NBP35 family ATP-binding protein [Bacilli bacterium]|nr:Mrp/NBP35 family ATP-binding protein [Bacilli bacterium]
MSECNHNCENCDVKDCGERSLAFTPHQGTRIKNTIGIVSAKGGVGKSLITSLLAIKKVREGKKVAILDADVTGPSIPKSFNLKGPLYAENNAIKPLESKLGIKIVSASLLLDNNSQPILWRGPLIAGMVKQFYTDVNYGDLDYLFIDMPPGTGDVSLTVFQSLNLTGIIIVTTPQDLVTEIVTKAIEMANKMNIKIIGIIENMAYLECPDCKKKIDVFGISHLNEITNKYNLKVLGRIPINAKITNLIDTGSIENIESINIDY